MMTETEKPRETYEEFDARYQRGLAALQQHPEFKKWKITSYRALRTRDGAAWTCNLRFAGKLVGDASNGGRGGPDEIRVKDEAAKASMKLLATASAEFVTFEYEGLVLDAMLTAAGK